MVWLVASCEPPLWWPVSMWSVGTAGVVCARPARSDLYGGGARRRQTPPYGRSGAVLRRAADAAVGRRRRHRRCRVDAQRRLKTTTPRDAPPPRPFLPSTPTETGTAPPAPPQWVHNGACRHFPRITHVTCDHKFIILFIIIQLYYIIIYARFIFYDGSARKLYWLKHELIEGISVVGVVDWSLSGEKWDFFLDENSTKIGRHGHLGK